MPIKLWMSSILIYINIKFLHLLRSNSNDRFSFVILSTSLNTLIGSNYTTIMSPLNLRQYTTNISEYLLRRKCVETS